MIQKISPTNKQTVLTLGLLLIGLGLVCNQWLLTALFSADGVLAPRSVVIIVAQHIVADLGLGGQPAQ